MATSPARVTAVAIFLAMIPASGTKLAFADEPAPVAGTGMACVITGNAQAPKDQAIWSAATGGTKVGVFTGALAPLKAANFPADPNAQRVQVNAGGGFRVEGFTDPKTIPVWTTRDVPVVADHVWISGGRSLKVIGAAPDQIRVELPARGSLGAAVQAYVPCGALSFGRTSAPLFETPGNGRGYVSKRGQLDLYASPNGNVVHQLNITGDGSGLVLWSTETRGNFVHVIARFDLFVDAWVKVSDVKPLPRGEMMDQLAQPETAQNPPALALQNYQRVMQAPRNVIIRAARGENQNPIGEVEQGAEIYVLDTVLGWASVLPKALHVMPPDDRSFWVKASELGITPPPPPAPTPPKK